MVLRERFGSNGVFVLILVCLAIIANFIGWGGGADKILTAALVLVGSQFFWKKNSKETRRKSKLSLPAHKKIKTRT